MKVGAERVVFAGFLGTTAVAVYTNEGKEGSIARVLRIRATNTDAADVVNCSVVPAGGTLSDLQYAELVELPLAAFGENKSVVEYEPDARGKGMKVRNGERIVMWAGSADVIAARVEVEEVT